MIKYITSTANPWYKSIKKLQTKKARMKDGKFILEGLKPTMEALASNKVEAIALEDGHIEKYASMLRSADVPLYSLSEKLFRDITETQTPQGILSVVRKSEFSFSELISQKNAFFLLLDHISDPGNMGTLIRSADAFGLSAVFLTKGCVDPYSGKAIRSTMGSILRVPILEITDQEEQKLCEQQNLKIISAMLEGQVLNEWKPETENTLLILGNEANGIAAKWDAYAAPITIPMRGKAESLNVAVAGSILIQRMMEKVAYNLLTLD